MLYVYEDFRAVCSRKANMCACNPDLIQFAIITGDVLVNGRAVALYIGCMCSSAYNWVASSIQRATSRWSPKLIPDSRAARMLMNQDKPQALTNHSYNLPFQRMSGGWSSSVSTPLPCLQTADRQLIQFYVFYCAKLSTWDPHTHTYTLAHTKSFITGFRAEETVLSIFVFSELPIFEHNTNECATFCCAQQWKHCCWVSAAATIHPSLAFFRFGRNNGIVWIIPITCSHCYLCCYNLRIIHSFIIAVGVVPSSGLPHAACRHCCFLPRYFCFVLV